MPPPRLSSRLSAPPSPLRLPGPNFGESETAEEQGFLVLSNRSQMPGLTLPLEDSSQTGARRWLLVEAAPAQPWVCRSEWGD